MESRIDEIADDVFRLSTFIPEGGMMFNQFLVRGDEPLLFHTGMRALYPVVSELVGQLVPIESLRWITFGHVEADECASMNNFLAAAPNATVAHGALGCVVQVNDWADRPPRPLTDGEVIDLGGKRVRSIDTPHVPHGWDAHVMFEEVTGTLLCGDLFTAMGPSDATTTSDVVGPALEAEAGFAATALTPTTGAKIRSLADLEPTSLALMHGPTYQGDCSKALLELGDAYQRLFEDAAA